MTSNSLITESNGSLPMTELTSAADDDDHPQAYNNDGVETLELRKRKITQISMGSTQEESTDDADTKEDSNAPKGSKAQKLKDAIMSGNLSTVQSVLDQKIDVNISDSFGRSALHNAVLKGDPRIVEMILNANGDVNIKDDREDSPLHYASRTGNAEILEILLSKPDCEVNMKGSGLNSPLHLAASLNKPDLCKLLLEHHANPNIQEESGKTPLGRAVESGSQHSAKYLLEYMKSLGMAMDEILYNSDYDGTTLLHLAVDSGFKEVVEICLENGARIRHPRRKDRTTAFHLACEQGSSSIVELLVQHDPAIAKILLVNSEGLTPLHQAAKSNSYGIADILIEQGAKVDARSNDNRTPLMLAGNRAAIETVKLLLEKGANPTLKDVDNRTAVFDVVGHGSACTDLILQNQALAPLLTEKDLNGFSAAHYAAKKNDSKSMALFLEHNKATGSVLSDQLDTPLHVAAKYGCHEVIRVLLDNQSGKIINSQDSRSRTALHLACSGGHYKAAILLLGRGAAIEKDQNCRTALHEAANNAAKKVVELIVEKHSYCLNYVDDDKNTALHLAVQQGHTDIISLLLSLTKQQILLNSSNQNILDLAVELDDPKGAEAIVEHNRWREVLLSCTTGVSNIMKRLVVKMPQVAERIFDNCIESEGDKTNKNYRIKFDLSVILRKSDDQQIKSSLEVLKVIADNRVEGCLVHRLSFIALSTKWNSYGWLAFIGNILTVLVYLIPLTALHTILENDDHKYCSDLVANSATGQLIYLMSGGQCNRINLGIQAAQYLVLAIAILLLIKEVFQVYEKRLAYFANATNLMELVALLSAIVSIIPTCECKWGYQRQSAAVSLFFGWINMIMYLKGLPFYGKYVIMLYTMFVTLIKVMALFLLFALAFGTTFHLIVDQDPFTSLANIMMHMFIMMLGEINYTDVFMPWNKLSYPLLSNLMLILFCLTMPIILMNMLVGLSVGDIDAIEQSALLDRYVLQIDLLHRLEESFPQWLLRKFQKKSFTYYPNKGLSIRDKVFNALIGFGEVESEDSQTTDGEDLQIKVNEMHEKLDEQSQSIDEMKTTMTSMFEMMKHAEAEREEKMEKVKKKETNPSKSQGGVLPGISLLSLPVSLPGLPGSLPTLSFGFGAKKSEDSTTPNVTV